MAALKDKEREEPSDADRKGLARFPLKLEKERAMWKGEFVAGRPGRALGSLQLVEELGPCMQWALAGAGRHGWKTRAGEVSWGRGRQVRGQKPDPLLLPPTVALLGRKIRGGQSLSSPISHQRNPGWFWRSSWRRLSRGLRNSRTGIRGLRKRGREYRKFKTLSRTPGGGRQTSYTSACWMGTKKLGKGARRLRMRGACWKKPRWRLQRHWRRRQKQKLGSRHVPRERRTAGTGMPTWPSKLRWKPQWELMGTRSWNRRCITWGPLWRREISLMPGRPSRGLLGLSHGSRRRLTAKPTTLYCKNWRAPTLMRRCRWGGGGEGRLDGAGGRRGARGYPKRPLANSVRDQACV